MEKTINFTSKRFIMLALSVVLIAAFWIGTFLQGGFELGIDFKSGLNQRVVISVDDAISDGDVEAAIEGMITPKVQTVGDAENSEFMIRVGVETTGVNIQDAVKAELMSKLETAFGVGAIEIRSTSFVGPSFAGSLTSQTIIITGLALLLILVYIWIRFKFNYALSAIAAIFHDVLFLVGFIGVCQLEFSTATIAAVLTIIGYSLNDTIVIFDRIRENSKTAKNKTFEEVINISVTQSLSRTIITSVTTLIAVTSIFVLATGSIKEFALGLIVGVLVGTYSSVFIASSILLGWHNLGSKKIAKTVHSNNKGSEKVLNFNKA